MKTILFFCDGGPQVGAGHVFRCLSIAKEVRQLGLRCLFAAADAGAASLIRQSGFDCLDGQALQGLPAACTAHAVLVDSHRVSGEELSALGGCCPVLYLDDVPLFAYPVHTLINGHIYADPGQYRRLYAGSGLSLPRMLLGPDYMPIDPSYSPMERGGTAAKTVLFLAGGTDPDHVTLRLARQLSRRGTPPDYRLVLVVGALNPDWESIASLAQQVPQLSLVHGVSRLAPLFRGADLAVSAAGITLYELAASALPALSYSLADNQIPVARAFDERGICQYIGDSRNREDFAEAVLCHINNILYDKKTLRARAALGASAVDGRGAARIARELAALCI